jgi:hypothetical protein
VQRIKDILNDDLSGLPTAKLACGTCDPETHAETNTITKRIKVCNPSLGKATDAQLERTIIHEGLHAFAGFSLFGTRGLAETYHGEDCEQGDAAHLSHGGRMQNADSYACLVALFTGTNALGADVSHSRGETLRLEQKPSGPVSLSGPDTKPEFSIDDRDLSSIGIGGIRWILKDDQGRRYLMRWRDEIIDPTESTRAVRFITIGAKTRALLKERGVTKLKLTVVITIPDVGDRVQELDIALVP